MNNNSPQAVTDLTTGSDPWMDSATASPSSNYDWLNTSATDIPPEHFNIMSPFQHKLIPFDSWVTNIVNWVVVHFRPVFQVIRVPVDFILSGFEQFLMTLPPPITILFFALLAWQLAGAGVGAVSLISLIIIGAIGAWSEAMITMALVLTALLFCIIIGLPLGIWLARNERLAKIVRPLLDAMQTTPRFCLSHSYRHAVWYR